MRTLLKYIYALIFLVIRKYMLRINQDFAARIVLYHSIAAGELSDFERQIIYYKKKYNVISLSELVNKLNKNMPVKGDLAITFDDGFKDNLVNAAPVLKKHGLPATFFIATDFVELSGQQELIAQYCRKALGIKKVLPSLSWQEVNKLRQEGFEVGSHSNSHKNLARLEQQELCSEVKGSKEKIENKLGAAVKHFSFPFGGLKHASPLLIDQVKQAGYVSCSSGVRGNNCQSSNIWFLRRENMEPAWPNLMLEAILQGAFDRR